MMTEATVPHIDWVHNFPQQQLRRQPLAGVQTLKALSTDNLLSELELI